jgi:hypothetical protein
MDDVRVIDPEKLVKKRGDVPKSVIARRTGGLYTREAIRLIEAGAFRPVPEKIPILLEAYQATWEEVSRPITTQQAA